MTKTVSGRFEIEMNWRIGYESSVPPNIKITDQTGAISFARPDAVLYKPSTNEIFIVDYKDSNKVLRWYEGLPLKDIKQEADKIIGTAKTARLKRMFESVYGVNHSQDHKDYSQRCLQSIYPLHSVVYLIVNKQHDSVPRNDNTEKAKEKYLIEVKLMEERFDNRVKTIGKTEFLELASECIAIYPQARNGDGVNPKLDLARDYDGSVYWAAVPKMYKEIVLADTEQLLTVYSGKISKTQRDAFKTL